MAIFCTPDRFITIGVGHLRHSTTIANLSKRKTDPVKAPWGGRPQFALVYIRTRGSLLGTSSEPVASVKLLEGTFTRIGASLVRACQRRVTCEISAAITWTGPSRESPRQLVEPRM